MRKKKLKISVNFFNDTDKPYKTKYTVIISFVMFVRILVTHTEVKDPTQ